MGALVEDPDTALGVLFADIRDGYYLSEDYAAAMLAASARTDKPIAIAVNYSLVRHEHIALRLTQAGVPVLDGTAEALRAIKHALAYRDFQRRCRRSRRESGFSIDGATVVRTPCCRRSRRE